MRQYAKAPKRIQAQAAPTANGWDVIEVPSESNPAKTYRVDVTNGRCSCPAWKFQKDGERNICKHLRKLGFKQIIDAPYIEVAEPKSLQSLVKSKVKA